MAKKKTEQISVNEFEKVLKEVYTPTVTIDWNGLGIIIKKNLSLVEEAQFVDTCVKACFNDKTGEYVPEGKDFAIRSCILISYTNINLPTNYEKSYDFVYQSGIADVVTQYINPAQFDAITRAINDKIAYTIRDGKFSAEHRRSEFYELLTDLVRKVAEYAPDIGPEELQAMIKTLSSGKIDEDKLVKAYMENK